MTTLEITVTLSPEETAMAERLAADFTAHARERGWLLPGEPDETAQAYVAASITQWLAQDYQRLRAREAEEKAALGEQQ